MEPSPGSSSLTGCLTGTWWKAILPFPGPELPSKRAAPATWGRLGTWSRHSRPACHVLHVGDAGRVPGTRGWWPLPGTGPQGSLRALSAADEGCGAGQDRAHVAAPALAVRAHSASARLPATLQQDSPSTRTRAPADIPPSRPRLADRAPSGRPAVFSAMVLGSQGPPASLQPDFRFKGENSTRTKQSKSRDVKWEWGLAAASELVIGWEASLLTRLSWRSVLARHGLSPGPRPGPAGGGGRLPTLRKVRGVRGGREHCRAGVADSCVVCWLSLRTAADGHKAAAEALLRSAVPTGPCKISGRNVCVCCSFLINEKETTQRAPHSIQWESDGSRGFMKGAVFL